MKQKSRKAYVKRFKLTASGLLRRKRPGKRHNLSNKGHKRRNALGQSRLVSKGQTKTYKTLMGCL